MPRKRLLTLLAAALILGGLVRLAFDDERVEVALPDGGAPDQPAADAAPLVPDSLAALAAKR